MNSPYRGDETVMDSETNENEKRQQKESLAGSFDTLVTTNLLLVKTIQDAVPIIRQSSSPAIRRWAMAVAMCSFATLAVSAVSLVTVRNLREDNRALLTAFTEACVQKEKAR